MLFPNRAVLLAAMAMSLAVLPAAAAGHGAIERPAPQGFARPAVLRPDYDLAATLNAMIAVQLAAQDEAQADAANPYRLPRPRPDREHLVRPVRSAD
jgi:hypothetical protein